MRSDMKVSEEGVPKSNCRFRLCVWGLSCWGGCDKCWLLAVVTEVFSRLCWDSLLSEVGKVKLCLTKRLGLLASCGCKIVLLLLTKLFMMPVGAEVVWPAPGALIRLGVRGVTVLSEGVRPSLPGSGGGLLP